MKDLFFLPLADAFLQVGVFVAAMLLLFGYVQYRTGDWMTRFLAARWRTAPLFGALLGVTPGCGGAIIMMPLYIRGTVSFGTVIAALVSTMGDSSFVLFAAAPREALGIHLLLLLVGICSGYLTDALGIDPRSKQRRESLVAGHSGPLSSVGAAEAIPPAPSTVVGAASLGLVPATFWVLCGLGLVVGMPVLTGLTDSASMTGWFGGVDPYLITGVLGTVIAAVVYLRTRITLSDDIGESIGEKYRELSSTFVHCAREASFVTFWVAIAYLITTWLMELGGVGLTAVVAVSGVAGVLLGTAAGLIPGCAVQVVLTGLYVTGVIPPATLVANALSQDGDALFPLIMMDRRSAGVATVLTCLPALIVGGGMFFFTN